MGGGWLHYVMVYKSQAFNLSKIEGKLLSSLFNKNISEQEVTFNYTETSAHVVL